MLKTKYGTISTLNKKGYEKDIQNIQTEKELLRIRASPLRKFEFFFQQRSVFMWQKKNSIWNKLHFLLIWQ